MDVGHCCSIDDLTSSMEMASRSVPHMMFSRVVMSYSTGSSRISVIDERGPHYYKVSECRCEGAGERRGAGGRRKGRGVYQ